MAFKKFEIKDHLQVAIYKRRGARTMRLSISADNTVRVTIPFWLTYKAGLKFAESRLEWIKEHLRPVKILVSGQEIGKHHRLLFIEHEGELRTRVTQSEIRVYHSGEIDTADAKVQEAAQKACLRALKLEASSLLPPRLKELAEIHGYSFNKVTIKKMKSRWGSCDSNQNIVLNQYLIQLPWHLIDYVLLHELNHTVHMHHSPKFWSALKALLPNVKALRKEIKEHHPTLST